MIEGIAVGPIDHIGIAVHEIDSAAERYARALGARIVHREMVPGQAVEVAFLEVPGETCLELVCPHDPDSPIQRFLDTRGETLHHVCFRVTDIDLALQSAREAGLRLIDQEPRTGARGSRIAFLHPQALGGVLVELKQLASAVG